jgi:hypothetical protein
MRRKSRWKDGGALSGRLSKIDTESREEAARRAAHADGGRGRRLPLHPTRAENVHEHADGGGRWWSVVLMGVTPDGRAVGTDDDVREAECGGAVEWFSVFKHRLKRFYRRWPRNARAETAASWCEAFVAVYNVRGA